MPEFSANLLKSEEIHLKRLLFFCKGKQGSSRELSRSDVDPSKVQRRLHL